MAQKIRDPPFIHVGSMATRYRVQLDRELSDFAILTDLEQLTSVPRTYIVPPIILLVVLLHSFNASAAPISNLAVWAFPAYVTLKTVERPSPDEAAQWLNYWMLIGLLSVIETFSLPLILYCVPWYFLYKSAIVIWFQHKIMAHVNIIQNQNTTEGGDESDLLGLTKYAYSTGEKRYWQSDELFIKRNLDKSEYGKLDDGYTVIPYMCKERMRNECATIRYVQKNTNIPVPNIRCAFEDNGRFYLITDIVPGVTVRQLPVEKRAGPIKEIEEYRAQMHAMKSKIMGGISDNVIPYRITRLWLAEERDPMLAHMKFLEADTPEFVFCHNDLAQHNVIVDEETLRVKAILDWEYAGFYPPEFDGKFYLRPGPSVALEGEEDDVPKLIGLLNQWKDTLCVTAILDWEYAGFYPAEFEAKFYLRDGASVALEGEEDDVPKLMQVLEHWKA